MRKHAVITSFALLGIFIFIASGALNSLVLFLLVGAIPGTSYNVPSWIMLLLTICAIWFLLFRFTAIDALNTFFSKRTSGKKSAGKKHLPKRRFGQI